MLAASKIINEVRFILEKLLEVVSARLGVSRVFCDAAAEQLLVPAIPAITFAREVPVPSIGAPRVIKYKRFQWFGWVYG